MKLRHLWNRGLHLLAAYASPAGALAYHLGEATFGTGMVRRTMTTSRQDQANRGGSVVPAVHNGETEKDRPRVGSDKSWLGRAFERLEEWSWQRELRERERYLAQARDLPDLERRMRDLDRAVLSRARALR